MNRKTKIAQLMKITTVMFAAVICLMITCSDAFAAVKKGTYDIDQGNLPFTQEEIYSQLFDINNKIVIKVDIDKTELSKLQSDYNKYANMGSKSPIYRKCDLYVTICRSTDEYTYVIKETGIRLKGNTSRTDFFNTSSGIYNLVHFKLKFHETFDDEAYYTTDAHNWGTDAEGKALRKARKNRTFATLEKLDMKWNRNLDGTLIREYMASEMFRSYGVLTPHINLASLDAYNTHLGVYNIYESVDEIFLEKNLKESQLGGDLYKCGWTGGAPDLREGGSIGVEDEDACKFYNYDLKTNKKKSANESLIALIAALNKEGITKSEIASLVDMDSYLKFMAVSYFTGDPDDFRNNYNNYYIYFLKDSGKAIFIPYDLDRVFGISHGWDPNGDAMMGTDPFALKAYGAGDTQRNPLTKNTVCDGGFYVKEFADALKKTISSPYLTWSKFNATFTIAEKNYTSLVKPSKSFNNASISDFVMNNATGTGGNKTFAVYVVAIKKACNAVLEDLDTHLAPAWYVKGDFNNWSADSAYRMSYNASTGTYTYKMNAASQIKFKLCDANDNWKGMEVMYYFTPALNITEVGEHRNIIAPKGTYNICYNPAKDRLWITIYKTDQTITAPTKVTKTYGDAAFSLNAKTNSGAKLTYTVVNTKVCTVSADGKVALKGAYGKTTIYIKAAATTFYNAVSKKVEIVVNPAKEKITAAVSKAKGNLNLTWNKDSKVTGYEI